MDIALDGIRELVKSLSEVDVKYYPHIIKALEAAYPTFVFREDRIANLVAINVLRRPKQELNTDRIAPKTGKTDVVPALLRYLDEAQKGNVAEIAIACLWTDNQYGYTVSSARLEMLGCVDHMKHAMITSVE